MSGQREHGTHVCYVHGPDRAVQGAGCRCEPCRAANRDYERERSRRTTPPYVAAASTRAHLRDLMAAGVGLKTIARTAGLSVSAVGKILYGDPARGTAPSKRIRPATRDKLLAVTPADAAPSARIDAGPTWEIIDRLVDRGWTKTAIAHAIGQTGPGLQIKRTTVHARNARAIRALLDEPVPPRRTRAGIVEVEQELAAEPGTVPTSPTAMAAASDPLPVFVELAAWAKSAVCRRPDVPTWLFFPDRGDNETVERAKAVCQTCPVQAPCLEAALANREPGVWGGTSENQRRRMNRSVA